MKKIPVFVLIGLLFIISIFASGCTDNNPGFIILENEDSLSEEQCKERGLDDKLMMLESANCPHCKLAIPKLQELEEELNVEIMYLDISKIEDRNTVSEFRIMPKYTPTVLIGCEILIGDISKEEYKQTIEKFLENEG